MESSTGHILAQVELLSLEDDGIKLNRKLGHIQTVLQQDCVNEKHLRDVINGLNLRCLEDAEFGVKVSIMIASRTFSTMEMFGHRVRNLLLSELQENFENANTLIKTDEEKFYNSVLLIGEYYSRARLLDGNPLNILVQPILEYLQMFVTFQTVRGAKELVTQLSLNGSLIKSSHPSELENLMISVRRALLESDDVSFRIWLLLAVDLVNNDFNLLEGKHGEFYTEMIKSHNTKPVPTKPASPVVNITTASDLPDKVIDSLNISNSPPAPGSGVRNNLSVHKTIRNNSDDCSVSKWNNVDGRLITPGAFIRNINKLKEPSEERRSCSTSTTSSSESVQKSARRKSAQQNKIYLKEENVENLTWDYVALDSEAPPQVNPYAGMFKKYLSNN